MRHGRLPGELISVALAAGAEDRPNQRRRRPVLGGAQQSAPVCSSSARGADEFDYWWLGFESSAVLVTAWPAEETSRPAPATVLQAATARLAESTANKNNFFMMEKLHSATM
jgi:hypothetical protein